MILRLILIILFLLLNTIVAGQATSSEIMAEGEVCATNDDCIALQAGPCLGSPPNRFCSSLGPCCFTDAQCGSGVCVPPSSTLPGAPGDPNAHCIPGYTSNWCATGGGSPGQPGFTLPGYGNVLPPGSTLAPALSGSSKFAIGSIVTQLLPYTFIIAGLLLFGYLLYGAFHLATSFGSPKAIWEAWLIIFRALAGFAMVFISFWLVRVVEIVFGLRIL